MHLDNVSISYKLFVTNEHYLMEHLMICWYVSLCKRNIYGFPILKHNIVTYIPAYMD